MPLLILWIVAVTIAGARAVAGELVPAPTLSFTVAIPALAFTLALRCCPSNQ